MAIDAGYDYANDGGDRYANNSRLLDVVDSFDKSNQTLYALVEEIASSGKVAETDSLALSHYASSVATAWSKVAQQLLDDVGLEGTEFASTIAGMWVQDEAMRACSFNRSIPEANVSVVMDGDAASLSREIHGSYEEALEGEVDADSLVSAVHTELCRNYANNLKQDVRQTLNAMIVTSSRQPELETEHSGKRNELLSKIGKEALSAVKIAAGVAVGVVVGQWISRKR